MSREQAEMIEVVQIIERMRERLTPVAAWTQDASARDNRGQGCLAGDAFAVCWCLTGAMYVETPYKLLETIRQRLKNNAHVSWLPGWNDWPGRTHEEVLGLIDATLVEARRDLANWRSAY